MEITNEKIDEIMLSSYRQGLRHAFHFIEMYQMIHWDKSDINNLLQSFRDLNGNDIFKN